MDNFKKLSEADTSMDNGADSSTDCSVDRKLQEIFGLTDEQLLTVFEAAEKDTSDLPIPAPPENEFETIWSRIQEDTAEPQEKKAKIIKVRFNWKRLAAVGLIACLMAGGCCFVALGRKSYFYRERVLGGGTDVLINDEYRGDVNGEEEAYEVIEKELGITPLRLGYMPPEMKFRDFELRDGYAKIGFQYGDQIIYFIQSKYEKAVSYQIDTDSSYENSVYNRWLNQKLKIEKELVSDGSERYAVSFIYGGSYYRFVGGTGENEFIETIKRIVP